MGNILLDSIKFNSYSGNLTSKISDHQLQISGLSASWENLKTWNYHGIQISIMENLKNLEKSGDFVKIDLDFFLMLFLDFI